MIVPRMGRSAGMAMLAAFAALGCATRVPEKPVPQAKISLVPVWVIEPGDVIRTRIYREPDLSGETVVSSAGHAYFPGLGRVPVTGLSLDSLQADLASRYGKLVLDAVVDVSFSREIAVYGQVRWPGVYPADPSVTVLGMVAKAGGATGSGKTPLLTLVKGDGRELSLPREVRLVTLDIEHGDALFVQEDSFLGRNVQTFSQAGGLISMVLSVLSVVFIMSR